MQINWKEIDMKKVGSKLAYVRESKEQKQYEFIKGSNIDFRRYSKYERGLNKPKNKEKDFLELLSKHKINIQWLLYDDNAPIYIAKQPNKHNPKEELCSGKIVIISKNGSCLLEFNNKPLSYKEKILNFLDFPI